MELDNPQGKMIIILRLFCEETFSSLSSICQKFQTKLLVYFIRPGPLKAPVIIRAALYWTILVFLLKGSFNGLS